jgi:hypothetical protein
MAYAGAKGQKLMAGSRMNSFPTIMHSRCEKQFQDPASGGCKTPVLRRQGVYTPRSPSFQTISTVFTLDEVRRAHSL